MVPVVMCHKLEFPKTYSTDLSEVQEHMYSRVRCGKPSNITNIVAYVCNKCKQFFTSFKAVQAHGRTHTDTPYSCDKCGQRFLSKERFQIHILRHSPAFYCELCDKKFTKFNVHHYVSHKNLKHSFKCSLCKKSFVTIHKLSRHINIHHPESKFPFKCNLCEERFSSEHKLQNHTKEHEMHAEREAAERQLKKLRCSFCAQLCLGVKSLAAHYRSHTVLKSSDEDNASKKRKKQGIKDKMKQEEEEEEAGNFGSDLKMVFGRLTLYNNRRLYVCYICDRYFDHKRELKSHVKLHADGTSVCTLCELDYGTSDTLKKHKNRVHLYQCKMCYLAFVKKSQLKEHKACHAEPIDDGTNR